jgi:methionyl-tRNA formyltransferase
MKTNNPKKILFLGPNDSTVLKWLRENGEDVVDTENKISVEFVQNNGFNFLISYGYRHIIREDILVLFPQSAINLHISYLPFNRGADPNFWSFIEGTPKGVSIHYIDAGIDTGDIIVQKEISFDISSSDTLASTYQKLHVEIQDLFFQNWDYIKSEDCRGTPQKGEGTFHRLSDKKPFLYLIEQNGWNTTIDQLISQKHSKI